MILPAKLSPMSPMDCDHIPWPCACLFTGVQSLDAPTLKARIDDVELKLDGRPPVADQLADKGSMHNWYARLLNLRKTNPAIRDPGRTRLDQWRDRRHPRALSRP